MANHLAPTNTAGVQVPEPPANPPSLSDITNARDYVEKLAYSRASRSTNHATSDELGSAEAYKASIVFSHSVGGDTGLGVIDQMKALIGELRFGMEGINRTLADTKTQLVDMINTLDMKINTLDMKINTLDMKINTLDTKIDGHTTQLTEINQRLARLPVIISNAQSGPVGPIWNPFTITADGSAPKLQPPNPTTYQELQGFTKRQCMDSAADLGLPALPPNATVETHRRQIAAALGLLFG